MGVTFLPVMRRFPMLAGAVTGAAVLLATALAWAAGGHGYDVSWPQCGSSLPTDGDFRLVGVSGGKPFTDNPCLGAQFQWATLKTPGVAFYLNTANPGPASQALDWFGQKSPDASCSPSNEAACAFNYGYNAAAHAFAYAQAQAGAAAKWSWWLDVEVDNSWSTNTALNVVDLSGSVAYLRSQGVPVGVYSTGYQWGRIAGGAQWPDVPVWLAGAASLTQAATWCGPDRSFTGGPVVIVQWLDSKQNIDVDHACLPLPVAAPPAPPARTPNGVEQLVNDLLGTLTRLLTPR